jgi:hypothetical protein
LVVADHHPAPTQAGLGNERVGRPQIAGGHLVGRQSRVVVLSCGMNGRRHAARTAMVPADV